MASGDAFFRIRPTKRSNPEARTTLDSLHNVRIQSIAEKERGTATLKKEIAELVAKCRGTSNEIEYEQIQKQINAILI